MNLFRSDLVDRQSVSSKDFIRLPIIIEQSKILDTDKYRKSCNSVKSHILLSEYRPKFCENIKIFAVVILPNTFFISIVYSSREFIKLWQKMYFQKFFYR